MHVTIYCTPFISPCDEYILLFTHTKAMTKIGFVTDHNYYLLQVIGSQSKLYHQIDKGGGTCKTPLSPPSHSRACFHDGSNHDITRTITPPLMSSVNIELQTYVPRADASPPRGSRHSELLPYTKYTQTCRVNSAAEAYSPNKRKAKLHIYHVCSVRNDRDEFSPFFLLIPIQNSRVGNKANCLLCLYRVEICMNSKFSIKE